MQESILQVKNNIKRAALASDRDPNDITLIAVSKTRSLDEIRQAINCGLMDFGENRVQELQQKIKIFPKVNWHMIGSLQTNKVKYIIDKIHLLHSLDRMSLADEVNKRAMQKNICVNALIQVNVSGEKTKHGIKPNEVVDFCDAISVYNSIKIAGLMTIAPICDDPKEVREVFKSLKLLRNSLLGKVSPKISLRELSMGMSSDYQQAIMEGATIVRVGTKIFGERNY